MVETLGTISRISKERAYVVVDTNDGERVHETPASFYVPLPNPGDLLVRMADGTLAHVEERSDNVAICGPAILNDRLDRISQQLTERCR